jgi:hypothetical protein
VLLLVFGCLCLVVVSAKGQQTLGSLNGTVLDPTGAAVPAATVTATDPDIGVTRAVKSGGNGFFQIFNLPIGIYQVTTEHDGFETTKQTGISIQESHATTANVTLKIGQMATSVEVTANPMLNATDTTIGYTLDRAADWTDAPGDGQLYAACGAVAGRERGLLLSGFDSNAGLGNQPIWANGQRDTSNTFQVNGVDAS